MVNDEYRECTLCPRNCRVNRFEEKGFCKSSSHIKVARASLHMWEEPCISGVKGSGTVFFGGCSLKCVYCQNWDIASGEVGKEISEERLSDIFLELQEKGAHNINLVTPDHYLPSIREALISGKKNGLNIPIIMNCSGYEKASEIKKLDGLIDIFLTDFKYMEEDLAEKLSKARDYPHRAKEALEAMVSITGNPRFDDNQMMTKGVLVRHLLLPGHKKNAKAVLSYLKETYGEKIIVSIMNQYTPFESPENVEVPEEMKRKVTKREYENVVSYALSIGLHKAFIQEGDTAKESFIPNFDFTGV